MDRAFASYTHDEQLFNACLAVLRLAHRYGAARLERACGLCLYSIEAEHNSHGKLSTARIEN